MTSRVTNVRFTPATCRDVRSGLLGFVSFLLGGCMHVDGVSVRKTAAGRTTLTFPARRDSRGQDHPYLRPVDQQTRISIESQIFASLGLSGVDDV